MKNRKCPVCQAHFTGRTDKTYCSSECKTAAYYEKRKEKEKLYFKVDAQLKTNRKLLKKYNQTGKTTLRREVLHKEGFNPNFFTHFRKTADDNVYFYCYDFGFMKITNKQKLKYLIIHWDGR